MRLKLLPLLSAAVCITLSANAEELSVYAAVSLTDALEEIGKAYQAATGNSIVFNLGASSDLARQIQAGAPADVFFSADAAQMDAVERAGLVRATDRVRALSNVLVAMVPVNSTVQLASAADLVGVKRLALADPQAVPAGVYARSYLQSIDLWDELKAKVIPMLNVRAALAAVESENADAAIVYRTDAIASKRVRVAFEVPREQRPKILYVLAPIVASKKPGATGLVRFLVSSEARKVYERYGFIVIAGD